MLYNRGELLIHCLFSFLLHSFSFLFCCVLFAVIPHRYTANQTHEEDTIGRETVVCAYTSVECHHKIHEFEDIYHWQIFLLRSFCRTPMGRPQMPRRKYKVSVPCDGRERDTALRVSLREGDGCILEICLN